MNSIGPIIASVETGRRNKMNTSWPVENIVRRSGRKWLVTFGLCNGIATSSKLYSTKREAFEQAGIATS